ncbi:hypothetical protein N7G274_005825 [Stereocaulon virgatum]|uniref:Uncharacterized protein n=1 Tax=Stereocaulon virgatum TaxID=373712 RepID=A0ABR4A6Y9_9LECA
MTKSWDWKTNISEIAVNKTANSQTGITPPMVSRGALYKGSSEDENIYSMERDTIVLQYQLSGLSEPDYCTVLTVVVNVVTRAWDRYDVTFGSPNRPSSGSYADAIDQGLSFLNIMLDSGSERQTQNIVHGTNQYLECMVVIDTNSRVARNVSIKAVVGDMPRARGHIQYVASIGTKGILIQIGGYLSVINCRSE